MSAGTLQRIEQGLFNAWHILDHIHLRRLIMDGFTRLSNDLDKAISDGSAKDAKIADLEQQLAAAKAQPTGGATEDQLNSLADKLEAAMGGSSAKPDLLTSVGSTSTTATDPSTGNTTTIDHATGTATTTDASGVSVVTDPVAAQAATSAAQAAGVTVPSA